MNIDIDGASKLAINISFVNFLSYAKKPSYPTPIDHAMAHNHVRHIRTSAVTKRKGDFQLSLTRQLLYRCSGRTLGLTKCSRYLPTKRLRSYSNPHTIRSPNSSLSCTSACHCLHRSVHVIYPSPCRTP